MTEYFDATTEEAHFAALQSRIDDGSIWRLEGSAGRAAMDAIHAGRCTLGPIGYRDYWGNYIPSRDEVEPGTVGSREYAETQRGVE